MQQNQRDDGRESGRVGLGVGSGQVLGLATHQSLSGPIAQTHPGSHRKVDASCKTHGATQPPGIGLACHQRNQVSASRMSDEHNAIG